MASDDKMRLTIGGTPINEGQGKTPVNGVTPNASVWPVEGTRDTEAGRKTHREVWGARATDSAV